MERVEATNIERWATLATATAVMAYGLSRRSATGVCLAAAATPLAYRGLVGEWPTIGTGRAGSVLDDTRTALSGRRGVRVRESMRLQRPVDEVYRFWRHLQNLPRFMTSLERVTDLGDGRSHWIAKGPADAKVEWDAAIINEVENKVIGWRSEPGSDIVTAGSVSFEPARGGLSTQVSVHLQYALAGHAAGWLTSFIDLHREQAVREDLRRLKQYLETGEIARATADNA